MLSGFAGEKQNLLQILLGQAGFLVSDFLALDGVLDLLLFLFAHLVSPSRFAIAWFGALPFLFKTNSRYRGQFTYQTVSRVRAAVRQTAAVKTRHLARNDSGGEPAKREALSDWLVAARLLDTFG
jgi:hypothetical protein